MKTTETSKEKGFFAFLDEDALKLKNKLFTKKEECWGALFAWDLFFSGMGCAMICLVGLSELIFGFNAVSPLASLFGFIFIIMGMGLLLLELGRPGRMFRVFSNPNSVMTIGAVSMSITVILGILYSCCSLFPNAPWNLGGIRFLLALFMIVCGLFGAVYPGILLGSNKARVFWHGSGILAMFAVSSFVTALGGIFLCDALWAPLVGEAMAVFRGLILILLGFQLIFCPCYLLIKRQGGKEEALAAEGLKEKHFIGYYVGILFLGTFVPFILFFIHIMWPQVIGALLIWIGGLSLRFLAVKLGEERTMLPGEASYKRRLPKGTEKFLQ